MIKIKTIKLGKTYYITKTGNNISLENAADNDCIAEIMLSELVVCGEKPDKDDIYFAEKYTDCGGGLYKRHVKIVNYSNITFEGAVVLNAKINFKPENVVIPCIFYNGNEFGDGNSPKGFEKDGEPWVFAYDRTAIPSCTMSENKECMFAMFASDYDSASLKSSCSIEKNADGELIHKLIYPVIEKPVSYTGKNIFTEGYETYITFYPGTAFEVQSYFFADTPEYENYGYKNLLRYFV